MSPRRFLSLSCARLKFRGPAFHSVSDLLKLLRDLGNDYAQLSKRVAVDHGDTVRLQIHPLRHVEVA